MTNLPTTADHINAWGRMRKYYRGLMKVDTRSMDRRLQAKVWHEQSRVLAWIQDAERMIQIQFIPMSPTEDWGKQTGY